MICTWVQVWIFLNQSFWLLHVGKKFHIADRGWHSFYQRTTTPTSSKTSTAWHMCTGLMDIQQSVSAITRPTESRKLHRIVPVVTKTGAVKQCRGGVSTAAILDHFQETISKFFEMTYMATLSPEHRTIKMSDAKESCENLRYSWIKKRDIQIKISI